MLPSRRGLTRYARNDYAPEAPIYCLVLWNIDLTLVDVGRVTRVAYAEAFRRVTGRPLVQLPQMAGRIESEIFFDALALNEAAIGTPPIRQHGSPGSAHSPGWTVSGSDELLARFTGELAASFGSRRALLREQGRILPGAWDAVSELARHRGVVQSLLTGTIKPNAVEKLRAFGLDTFFDYEVGGYGSEVYPKGAQLLMTRGRAAEKYGVTFDESSTVYIGDSSRDVEAARMGGARCIAVASGRSTVGELRDAGADVVFADLVDTAAVIQAIDRLTMLRAAG
jgi:phosphoglycolate phosphatase